jgi:hypothetical protein
MLERYKEKFISKINMTDSCWLWTGRLNSDGYGQFDIYRKPKGAHVLSYLFFKGSIPNGKEICHTHSGNRHCVNPKHLYAATHAENMRDRLRHGTNPNKNKTQCRRGHEYNEQNTYTVKNKRHCRQCQKINIKKYKEKNSECR